LGVSLDRRVIIATIFFVLIITLSLVNGGINQGETESVMQYHDGYQRKPTISYTSHIPIIINNNANFSSQGWPGSGISGDPYVIEGLEINAYQVCINITDITVYFEIRNCMILSGGVSSFDGIVLDNVTHGSIIGCIVERHYMGITVQDSPGCILTGNTASNNSLYGFGLDNSISCTLINNTAFANLEGFNLYQSDFWTLTHNTALSNRWRGFFMADSDNGTLMNNTASSKSGFGFTVVYCHNSLLTDNTAIGNTIGFYLDDSDNCTLTYNIASDDPRDFYDGDGFYLQDMNYCTLTHNTAFSNSRDGFNINSSNNCTLTHNTAFSNSRNGIIILMSDYTTLYLNQLGNNGKSNALDDGESNDWDDGISKGNYWLDYNGTGTYTIPGTAGSVDRYPFVWVPETTSTTGGGDNTILFLVIICSGIAVVVIVATIYIRKRNAL